MKKFGTPIGAGPGIANEYVGLFAAGTPGPLGKFAPDVLVLLELPAVEFELVVVCVRDEVGWLWAP